MLGAVGHYCHPFRQCGLVQVAAQHDVERTVRHLGAHILAEPGDRCAVLGLQQDVVTADLKRLLLPLQGQVADRVMAINDGRLLAIGTPDEVRENAEVQQAYLGVTEDVA